MEENEDQVCINFCLKLLLFFHPTLNIVSGISSEYHLNIFISFTSLKSKHGSKILILLLTTQCRLVAEAKEDHYTSEILQLKIFDSSEMQQWKILTETCHTSIVRSTKIIFTIVGSKNPISKISNFITRVQSLAKIVKLATLLQGSSVLARIGKISVLRDNSFWEFIYSASTSLCRSSSGLDSLLTLKK